MFDTIIWGLVQGLTEFLPISSSGHLVLVPALLAEMGVEIGEPSLAASAVLHLGTLVAVLVFYRSDLIRLLRFRTDQRARHTIGLLALGTLPAAIGLPLRSRIEAFESVPTRVALALVVTGLILLAADRVSNTTKSVDEATPKDALLIGLAQSFALIPGISRSGSTMTMGLFRGLDRVEAARFSFLLAIPAIAAAGLLSLGDLTGSDGSWAEIAVGFAVAGVTGYLAIAALLKLITTRGFLPFAIYCFSVAAIAFAVL